MTEGDIAYFIYLMLFLAFIGASYFFSRRGQLGQSLQQMAIWCLIFFGFLAVYGMKDTIKSQLIQSPAMVEDMGSYVFQRDIDGHFYVTLTINDAPVRLVVDTGATGLVLTKTDAANIGLSLDKLNYSQIAYTANGTVASAPVVLDTVRIGNTVHEWMRASVNGGNLHSSLLGMRYISKFSEFRIVNDLLYLTP